MDKKGFAQIRGSVIIALTLKNLTGQLAAQMRFEHSTFRIEISSIKRGQITCAVILFQHLLKGMMNRNGISSRSGIRNSLI